jgi:putative chitinase
MPLDITDPIQTLWPDCPVPLLQGIIDTADDVFAKFEMAGNPKRIIPFMAEISAETGGGNPRELQENLNYSADGLLKTFHTHFTPEEAQACAHNPQAIANKAYGGRMGNTGPNDGWLFRGQGLLQTTGRGLYAELSQFVGIDLVANPGALLAPETALLCAVADFVCVCKCLPYCDSGEFLQVSALVNCGHLVDSPAAINGWEQRQEWYRRWTEALS